MEGLGWGQKAGRDDIIWSPEDVEIWCCSSRTCGPYICHWLTTDRGRRMASPFSPPNLSGGVVSVEPNRIFLLCWGEHGSGPQMVSSKCVFQVFWGFAGALFTKTVLPSPFLVLKVRQRVKQSSGPCGVTVRVEVNGIGRP